MIQPPEALTPQLHVFVSHAGPDQPMAERLRTHLAVLVRIGDVEVFSQDSLLGGDTARVLMDQAMARADIAVLLLSPAYLASAALQDQELPVLLHRHAQEGLTLLPIVIRPCVWDLHPVLGTFLPNASLPMPISMLTEPAQDQALADVVRLIAAHAPRTKAVQPPSRHDSVCPPLQHPTSTYEPARYVHRPREEDLALAQMSHAGAALVLWGPPRIGKTTFLQYLLQVQQPASVRAPDRVLQIDLGAFPADLFRAPDRFLLELARTWTEGFAPAVEAAGWVRTVFRRPGSATAKLTRLVEESLLSRTPGRLILAIDRADAAAGSPSGDGFFGMLRSWLEAAEQPAWSRLRLLLAVSETPTFLVRCANTSDFFGCATLLRVGELGPDGVRDLALRHGFTLDDEEVDRLLFLLSGSPDLLRQAMVGAGADRRKLFDVSQQLVVCQDYLEQRWEWLCQHRLEHRVCQLLQQPGSAISGNEWESLNAAGIVRRVDGIYRLRCRLYEAAFLGRCPQP